MAEREFVEEVPEKGTDNRRDGDARERAEERGRKEVERHSTGEGYPCEDEVHALLAVSLKEVYMEDLDLAAEPYHAEHDRHQR